MKQNIKQLEAKSPIPKYFQVKERLREAIEKKFWREGEQIPSLRELAQLFEVTPVTVSSAIAELEQEHFLVRRQGIGTFVMPRRKEKTFCAGVLMRTDGHAHGPMFNAISHTMMKFKYHLIPADITYGSTDPLEKEAKLLFLLERKPDALLVDGDFYTPFPLLVKYRKMVKNLLFFARYETKRIFRDASKILVDFEHAGFLAGIHLREKGCKKPLYFSWSHTHPPSHYTLGPEYLFRHRIYAGICRAYEKKVPIIFDYVSAIEELAIAIADGTDGVICSDDARARIVYRATDKAKKKIGKDLKIVGMFNTPWVDMLQPSLTSVDMNLEEIGRKAAETIGKGTVGQTIFILPEIITRDSTKE